jgi:hypothetical protein
MLKKSFCMLAAYINTVPTSDAPFSNYFGLPVDNPDGFYRTFPDTGKTYPAPVFHGVNQIYMFSFFHQ